MIEMSPTYEKSLRLTIHEVGQLVSERSDPAETLSNICQLIQQRFRCDVCSVYLLGADRAHLVLGATVGLRPEGVGRIRMRLDEGLAGMVAQQVRPLVLDDAHLHPRFKYFPESGEDQYRSFMGVPVIHRGVIQGVLVVQTKQQRTFAPEEVQTVTESASQLSEIISEARSQNQFVVPTHERLQQLAHNLAWCWDADTVSVFRDLDPVRWRELDHNPIALLKEVSLAKMEERASQMALHSRINHAHRRMEEYLQCTNTWGSMTAGILSSQQVAYFSAEFGLHESMPIYSGGLGVLAGDHIKSASDLGIPLIGIGLFYDQGYFRQRLDIDGMQHEEYQDTDVDKLPITQAVDASGHPLEISIPTRSGRLVARVWKLAVGRCNLYLLDSDVEGNSPEDRELTARLYGGDTRTRIRQELLLGVGGIRALNAMNLRPGVLHLNEGHSAFAGLEVIRTRMQEEGISFGEAARRVASHTVFTTHTPVPAGHDRFSPELVEEHLGPLRDELGISHGDLLSLGRVDPDNMGEPFCMTVLALKLSRRANGVSALHGIVSRRMWTELWPGRMEEEVPIGHITNGVHVQSWLAPQMHQIYSRHMGPDWPSRSGDPETWLKVDDISDSELWETHQTLKSRLLNFVRRYGSEQAARRGESKEIVEALKRALSLDTLTIGFARRFATYKRADLFMQELEEIASLINDPQTPIQLVFAGKAHPRDMPGKQVLQRVAQFARDPRFLGKVVFVEDYDINIGRHLVQGVDVWLNNPRRPLEASGTSGQKVVLNGGLNLSVLDGWWAEAYDGSNGFAIGHGQSHVNNEIQDQRDGADLLRALREEVVPLFYRREHDGLPRQWMARVKRGIRTLGWRFNADRMMMDYVLNCYVPAAGGRSSEMPSM